MKHFVIYTLTLFSIIIASCSDNDTFSTSYDNILTLESDTLTLDTVFSTIPTPHKHLMIHNLSGDGIRITNARLQSGNQSGFRVNINGSYLSKETGYQVSDIELRNGDSLRVFVELTSVANNDTLPRKVEDNIILTLENGRQQYININAYSWDVEVLRNHTIHNDTTIANPNGKPIVIYGTLTIDTAVTVTILPSTTLYFHNDAGIENYGTLKIKGEADHEVTLRCDRMDRMVSNLTYDNNPGQWGGIRIHDTSSDNEISFADIHGANNAIICDSSLHADKITLTLRNSTLHNLKGYGIHAVASNLIIENSQISNAFGGCVAIYGGNVTINNATIPQYYPFDARRGRALTFANHYAGNPLPLTLRVSNSLITGYANDVISWSYSEKDTTMQANFDHCQLRTDYHGADLPKEIIERDSLMFTNTTFEDPEDTVLYGRNTFKLFDTGLFFYDFHPVPPSPCIEKANPSTSLPTDRNGRTRNTEKPSIGCYEAYIPENETN